MKNLTFADLEFRFAVVRNDALQNECDPQRRAVLKARHELQEQCNLDLHRTANALEELLELEKAKAKAQAERTRAQYDDFVRLEKAAADGLDRS